MTTNNRPDCSVCVHRDPHPPKEGLIACGHPRALAIRVGPKARVLTIATGWGPIEGKVLGIVAASEAVYRGVMTWPFFFEAKSLLNCDGYLAR